MAQTISPMDVIVVPAYKAPTSQNLPALAECYFTHGITPECLRVHSEHLQEEYKRALALKEKGAVLFAMQAATSELICLELERFWDAWATLQAEALYERGVKVASLKKHIQETLLRILPSVDLEEVGSLQRRIAFMRACVDPLDRLWNSATRIEEP